MNLLQETLKILKIHGKHIDDIVWIGCEEFKITRENFVKIADIEYDNGFGGAEVAGDLLIVGKEFWLERHEYDGSEWWEFKTIPVEPIEIREVSAITRGQIQDDNYYWGGLKTFNGFE